MTPIWTGAATGRLELLGAYADMTGSLTLTTPTLEQIRVQLTPSNFWNWSAVEHGGEVYLLACLEQFESVYGGVEPARATVWADFPHGLGLGSSAALCVAMLRALACRAGVRLEGVELAEMAYRAEHDGVGIPIGRMDPYAIACGKQGKLLLMNHSTLERNTHAMPEGVSLHWLETGTRHEHQGESGLRKVDLEHAATRAHLRYVQSWLEGRCWESLERLGQAIWACGHSSALRLKNVLPEQEAVLSDLTGVLGAKITGGGFGGALVVLET